MNVQRIGVMSVLAGLMAAAVGCAPRRVAYVPVYTTQPASQTGAPEYSYNQSTYQPAPGTVPAPMPQVEPPAPAADAAGLPPASPPPGTPPPNTSVAPAAPPAPQVEYAPVAPGPEYVWAPGYWAWNGSWVWVRGSWVVRPHPHAVWVGGHWARRGHSYIWIGGGWR